MAMNTNSMNANSMMSNSMPMNSNQKMSGMSDMKSSPDAAKQPYDLQFLDTMSADHQNAIDMAETAVKKTQNQELKAFAQKIIADLAEPDRAVLLDWMEETLLLAAEEQESALVDHLDRLEREAALCPKCPACGLGVPPVQR